MSSTFTVHQAKTNLSRLIKSALRGDDIIIARGKMPVVRLAPLSPVRHKRTLGSVPDLVKRIAPDFDAPIPEFEDGV
ncbi:MAG: type II toxin-antitoxin system prevent-host-death family antitoxin [Fibrobacterota bacterium]